MENQKIKNTLVELHKRRWMEEQHTFFIQSFWHGWTSVIIFGTFSEAGIPIVAAKTLCVIAKITSK